MGANRSGRRIFDGLEMRAIALAFFGLLACGFAVAQDTDLIWMRAANVLARYNYEELANGARGLDATPEGAILVLRVGAEGELLYADVLSGVACELSAMYSGISAPTRGEKTQLLLARMANAVQGLVKPSGACRAYYDTDGETSVFVVTGRGVEGIGGVLVNRAGRRRVDNARLPLSAPMVRALSNVTETGNRAIIAMSDSRVAHGQEEDVIVDLLRDDGSFLDVRICPSTELSKRSQDHANLVWGAVYQVGLEAVFPPGKRDVLAYFSC